MALHSNGNSWLERTVVGVARRPRPILLIWAGLALLSLLGMANLRVDTSTASFLNRQGAPWAAYQASLDRFGGDEILVVAVVSDNPFDRAALADVALLTSEFETLPGVRRVDSLATVPLIRESPDGELRLDPALADGVPTSADDWAAFVRTVRSDRLAPGGLVSRDERAYAINLLLDRNVDADRAETVARVRELLDGRSAWVSGVPVFRTAVNSRTRTEVFLFVPLTLILIGLVLILAFGSIAGVLIPLLIGGLGAAGALGVMGAVGVTLSLATLLLPTVLLALGCAYSMHAVSAAQGHEDVAALGNSLAGVAQPIALSGLTTAIGFIVMATVGITAIRELATYGAVGVLVITAAALTLAPASLAIWPPRQRGMRVDAFLRHRVRPMLVRFIVQRRGTVVLAWLAAVALFGVGLVRLDVSTDIIHWFPEGSEIRLDYQRIRDGLSGITPVNVVISASGNRSVAEPGTVAAIDRLARDLEALPHVGKTISVADPLGQLHEVFEGADSGLPGSRAEIEQYLLLMSSAAYLDDVLTRDHEHANILLRVNDNSSDEIVGLSDWVDQWWAQHGVLGYSATTTGIMYEFARAEEEIAYGEIRGLALALGAIAVILLLLLRSPGAAALALIPNAIPIFIAFGFMGLLGVPLDAATVCVGSLALGIAVDNTIHVVTGYGDGLRAGQKPIAALDACLERSLPAVVLTTVAISLGFAVLAVSGFTLIRSLGLVISGLVVVCLAADTTLLPGLLLLRDDRVRR